MILTREQRLGATILFGIALIAWIIAAVYPRTPNAPTAPSSPDTPKQRTWEERKDSMRRADSLRYAQWAAEREQRYDSFRLADSLRRAEWKRERQVQYDSFRIADSLWRDSVGWRYPRRIKKDTIIDLNHCDTTDLLLLRGIGTYTARQIIRYREQLGGYYSPSQLKDEPFAKCHLDSLLASFIVDTAAIQRININTCSAERLQRHPYLRYYQAKAIYDFRRKNVRLRSLEELRSVSELTDTDLLRLAPYLSFE